MKKILIMIMTIFILGSSLLTCFAETGDGAYPAYTLYKLGLFNGTGTDDDGNPIFNLDNKLSRQEATTLLVRLLGKETDAQKEILDIPFTDVDDWAKPYVAYAYNQGLVNGIGETSFGSKNPISATEYLTLILRTLGYDDKQGDFAWDSAWTLSDQLKMTEGQYNSDTNAEFYRKDAVLISYMSLFQKIKGTEQTLANKLFTDEVFSDEQLLSTNDEELINAAGLIHKADNKVFSVKGVTFEQRGVYIKMTLIEPNDRTGIISYEALIYNKDKPEEGVHRSIKFDDATAHYRMDDPEIFVLGREYNTIKIISNAAEGYIPAVWESDISVIPVKKEITITEAYMVDGENIELTLNDVENGFMGYIFTRKDESVVEDEVFFHYRGKNPSYSIRPEKWSDEDKEALKNGEISVSITGFNIIEMTDNNDNLKIEFERIKSPKTTVK